MTFTTNNILQISIIAITFTLILETLQSEKPKTTFKKVYEAPSTEDTNIFNVDQSVLEDVCKDFDKTVREVVKNYKNHPPEVWEMIKETSINQLGIKCLPYMCSSLKFNNIEKIISLVDDQSKIYFSFKLFECKLFTFRVLESGE